MINEKNTTRSLRWIRPVVAVLAIQCLAVALLVWHRNRELKPPAISVQLLSTVAVIWRGDYVPLSEIQPSLKRNLTMMREHEFEPRFLIEPYTDTQAADIAMQSKRLLVKQG